MAERAKKGEMSGPVYVVIYDVLLKPRGNPGSD